jgi:hypothetical protein
MNTIILSLGDMKKTRFANLRLGPARADESIHAATADRNDTNGMWTGSGLDTDRDSTVDARPSGAFGKPARGRFTVKWVFLSLLLAAPALSQQIEIRTVRATHQQLVISYNAPAGVACKIEVSESPTYAPLVHDVNGVLFTGSDSDLTRDGAYIHESLRVVTIGQRRIKAAMDGKRYSLSLQAATQHYIRLSGCGSATAVIGTANIPFGPVSEPFPANESPGMEGYYGYATQDHTNRNQSFVDPLTGGLIRKLTIPSDYNGGAMTAQKLKTPPDANGWTNEGSALTADGAVASANTDAILFVPNDSVFSAEDNGIYRMSLSITGRITGGAAGEDAKIQVSLCTATEILSDWRDVALSTGSLQTVAAGDGTPLSPYWMKSGLPVEGWYSSTGGRGFCIRKKTANPAHTLEIDALAYQASSFEQFGGSTSLPQFCGFTTTTDASTPGKKWLLCYFSDRQSGAARLYSFDVTSGEAHYLGPLYMTYAGSGIDTVAFGSIVWDRVNPRRFYQVGTFSASRKRYLYRCDISSTPGMLTTDWTGARLQQPPWLTAAGCRVTTPAGFEVTDQVKALNHPGFTSSWETRVNVAGSANWNLDSNFSGNRLILRSYAAQDTGGWYAVYDPSATPPAGCSGCEGRIIAASGFGVGSVPQERKFCMIHSVNSVDNADWVGMGAARQSTLSDSYTQTAFGGPYQITVKRPNCASNCSIGPADTTFEIVPQSGSYDWVDLHGSDPADDFVTLEPGDLMIYQPATATDTDYRAGAEFMEVIAKNMVAGTITVRRGPSFLTQSDWIAGSGFEGVGSNPSVASIPAGGRLWGRCRASAPSWLGLANINWNYIADPLGLTYVKPAHEGDGKPYPPPRTEPGPAYPQSSGYASPNVHNFTNFGDHGTHQLGIRLQNSYSNCAKYYQTTTNVCYAIQSAFPGSMKQLNVRPDRTVAVTPQFAGKSRVTPAIYETHVKRRQYLATGRDLDWVLDVRPLSSMAQTATAVPDLASVYRVTGTPTLNRKHFSTNAFTGDRTMRDISGPGSLIDGSKPFTYCVALAAGECRPDSAAGQVYLNSPLRNVNECLPSLGMTGAYPRTRYGSCVEEQTHYNYGVAQTDISTNDPAGERTRMLTYYLVRPAVQSIFAVGYATPDAKWTLFLGEDHGYAGWYAVKNPPLPDAAKNPLTFERVPVDLYKAEAASFRIEFGYGEFGSPTEYRCTTRRDACVVDKAKVSDANPFQWASETLASIPCPGGRCKAEIPRVPGRVVFSRAIFLNGAGATIEEKILPPM